MKYFKQDIVCVLLAGGHARRMGGGDKCLKILGKKTLLAHVIERIDSQVDKMVINANGDPERFYEFNLEVISDIVPGHLGPLAGIFSALEWTVSNLPEVKWVLSVPTDAPFLPVDLVEKLFASIYADKFQENSFVSENILEDIVVCAKSGGRNHPVVALWPVSCRLKLQNALVNDGIRKIDEFTSSLTLGTANYHNKPIDPFMNINTLEDLRVANKLL